MKVRDMRRIAGLVGIVVCGIFGGEMRGGDFDEIVNALMENDRSMALAAKEAEASGDALGGANTLADPEAEFEFLAAGSGEKKYNFSISQGFDWPGVYKARSRQLELERKSLEYEYEIRYSEQLCKARGKLIDIIATNKIISQMSTAVEGCDRLLAVLEREFANGNVSVLDLNKVRIELADFKLQLAEAENNREELLSELTSNISNGEEIEEKCKGITEFPLMSLRSQEEYLEMARENSPELQSARNQTRLSSVRQEVTKKGLLPGFSVGYRLSHEDGILYNGFNVGVSVPMWRTGGERKAASTAVTAAKFAEEIEEIKLQKSIEGRYRRAANLKTTIGEYGASLMASNNEELLRKAYNSGVITLTELVTDINYFVEAGNRYVELQREYYNILSELSRYEKTL